MTPIILATAADGTLGWPIAAVLIVLIVVVGIVAWRLQRWPWD